MSSGTFQLAKVLYGSAFSAQLKAQTTMEKLSDAWLAEGQPLLEVRRSVESTL